MSLDESFTAFVHQHASSLSRVAYQLTHDPDRAAELLQDVLVRAYARGGRIDPLDAPHLYVRRMLVNAHLNDVRRQARVRARSAELATDHRLDESQSVVEREAMWSALGSLPDRQRAVLVLRHYEGCDDVEIARTLGCRRSTVRSLAARAAASLRAQLSPDHRPAGTSGPIGEETR